MEMTMFKYSLIPLIMFSTTAFAGQLSVSLDHAAIVSINNEDGSHVGRFDCPKSCSFSLEDGRYVVFAETTESPILRGSTYFNHPETNEIKIDLIDFGY